MTFLNLFLFFYFLILNRDVVDIQLVNQNSGIYVSFQIDLTPVWSLTHKIIALQFCTKYITVSKYIFIFFLS